MKQIVVLRYWIKNVTKSSLEILNQRNKESLFLNLFLSLMWFKIISIFFIECAIWQNLLLSYIRSLVIYIYIYIYVCIYIYKIDDWLGKLMFDNNLLEFILWNSNPKFGEKRGLTIMLKMLNSLYNFT